MDDKTDGWKASRKTTTTSFTICNMHEEKSIVDVIDVFWASFLIHILKKQSYGSPNIFPMFH
jgi:hypothetical protein